MPDATERRDQTIDADMRDISQEAKLDADLSAVPPKTSNATAIILLLVLATLAVIIGASLF